jgi:acetyl esterase
MPHIFATPATVVVSNFSVDGPHGAVPARRYTSTEPIGPRSAALVWVHGGAFSSGGLDQMESHAVSATVAAAGRTVVAVGYRRVPPWSWWRRPRKGVLEGIRFPVPIDDVLAVVEHLRKEDPRRPVALGGASAGACLAAGMAVRQNSWGGAMPATLILAYGTFHAALPTISPELKARIRGRHALMQFNPGVVERMNRNYAGSAAAMNDPFAFPGGHDVRGLPPTFLIDADRDSLRASGEKFAKELAAAGVSAEHAVVPDSTHGFLDRPGTVAFSQGISLINDRLLKDDFNTLRMDLQ